MRIIDIPEINNLSTSEKILLVEDLWDRITVDTSDIPIPQSHMEELDRRLLRYKTNPGNLLSLAELQEKITRRK